MLSAVAENGVVGARHLLADAERALEERLGVGIAALGAVEPGQPGNGCCELRMVLAMLLAGQGDVPFGYRDGFGVLALAMQLAHLGTEGSKVIGALRLRPMRPDARQQRNQPDQRRPRAETIAPPSALPAIDQYKAKCARAMRQRQG